MRRVWAALVIGIGLGMGLARGQDEVLLTLASGDPAHPVQFQALAEDEAPRRDGFSSRLDVPADSERPLIYTILQNTGWSEGTVELTSELLLADAEYVALEVEGEADGTLAIREGGLAFPLEREGEGFRLSVLLSGGAKLAIYEVAERGGTVVEAVTPTRGEGRVQSRAAAYRVDADAVFGAVVLDFHIVARAIPTPTLLSTLTADANGNAPSGSGQAEAGSPSEPTIPPPVSTESPCPPDGCEGND